MKTWFYAAMAAVLAMPVVAHGQGSEEDKFNVQLQGGMGGWAGDTRDDTTDVGPYYGVMGAFKQNEILDYEAGFQGFTNSFSDPSQGSLTAYRLQGDVRAGPELSGPVAWRPFAFAGVGLSYFVAGDSNVFGYTNSVQAEIPFGLGADFFTTSIVRVGARGTYNWNFGLGGEVAPQAEHPDSWQAGLTAAAVF